MGSRADRYAQRAFDFIERVNRCVTTEQVGGQLSLELKTFGFEYVTVWTVPPPGNPLHGILLNTRPEEYVAHYVEEDYVLRDPVVTHLRRTIRPYSWGDVRNSRDLSREEASIMDEAREFDVRDGLIIPIVTAAGSLAIVSPCGRAPDLSERARSAVSMISIFGQQSLKRAQMRVYLGGRPYEPLTVREREVLQLVAFGKNDGEIATVLSVKPTTVTSHVEHAKRKLGASNRSAAVYIAMCRDEIS